MTSARIDRFETQPRDAGGRVTAGWRITRYAFGAVTIQHLRTGRSHSGVDDGYGNIVYPDNAYYRSEADELVPFYPVAHPPHHPQ